MTARTHTHTEQLGTAPVGRLLLRLGLPGMVSMFIMTLYNITDTFWVAKLGSNAIAAITIAFPYQMLLVAIGVGSGAGFASLISRRFGQKLSEETNHIAGQVFPITFGFGLLFCFFTTFFADTMVRISGGTPDIHEYSRIYLTIIGFGVFFVFFSMMSNNILRGSGNTIAPMIFMGTSAIVNMILDPLLIFGIGFFPAWGVKGAAIATLISQAMGFLANCIYLLYFSGYRIRWKFLRPDFAILSGIYQVGLPTLTMQLVGAFIILFVNRLLNSYGASAIAAFGLVFRLFSLIIMPTAGLAQGLLPIVGYNYGALQLHRLWRAVRLATLGSFCIIGFGFILLQLFPAFWIRLFTQEENFLPLAIHATRIATLALPLVGPPFMWITTFQGLGKGRAAMFISLSRQLLLLLPLLIVLPKFFGLNGIWMSLPIADALAFLIAGIWIWHEYSQHQRKVYTAQAALDPLTESGPSEWPG